MRITAFALVILSLNAVGRSAQERPSFDGSWSVVPELSTYVNDFGEPFTVYVFNQAFTVRQTADTLTIAMVPLGGPAGDRDDCGLRWVYRLDGQASDNCAGRDHQTLRSTAGWKGSTLHLTMAGAVPHDGTWETYELHFTLTLNDNGTLRAEAPWGRDHAMIASIYRRLQ